MEVLIVEQQSASQPAYTYARPDYGRIHQELRRKGVALMLLWEELCAQVSDEHTSEHPIKPWRYSQFCENYRQFAKRLKALDAACFYLTSPPVPFMLCPLWLSRQHDHPDQLGHVSLLVQNSRKRRSSGSTTPTKS